MPRMAPAARDMRRELEAWKQSRNARTSQRKAPREVQQMRPTRKAKTGSLTPSRCLSHVNAVSPLTEEVCRYSNQAPSNMDGRQRTSRSSLERNRKPVHPECINNVIDVWEEQMQAPRVPNPSPTPEYVGRLRRHHCDPSALAEFPDVLSAALTDKLKDLVVDYDSVPTRQKDFIARLDDAVEFPLRQVPTRQKEFIARLDDAEREEDDWFQLANRPKQDFRSIGCERPCAPHVGLGGHLRMNANSPKTSLSPTRIPSPVLSRAIRELEADAVENVKASLRETAPRDAPELVTEVVDGSREIGYDQVVVEALVKEAMDEIAFEEEAVIEVVIDNAASEQTAVEKVELADSVVDGNFEVASPAVRSRLSARFSCSPSPVKTEALEARDQSPICVRSPNPPRLSSPRQESPCAAAFLEEVDEEELSTQSLDSEEAGHRRRREFEEEDDDDSDVNVSDSERDMESGSDMGMVQEELDELAALKEDVMRHHVSWPEQTALEMEDHLSRAYDIHIFSFFEIRERARFMVPQLLQDPEPLDTILEYPADWQQWKIESFELREAARAGRAEIRAEARAEATAEACFRSYVESKAVLSDECLAESPTANT